MTIKKALFGGGSVLEFKLKGRTFQVGRTNWAGYKFAIGYLFNFLLK